VANPLAGDCVNRVRALLQDSDTPYRYSDSEMFDAMNDGAERLLQLRPDYFIPVGFTITYVTQLTDTLSIPPALLNPLVMFTAGYMMLREDEFSNDGRAVAALTAPERILTKEPDR